MNRIILVLSVCLFFSCGSKVDSSELELLNGYWEIKQVILADGTKKEYKVNTTVDYIKLEKKVGFRKKVEPKFNGTYETSNDAEPFAIVTQNDSIILQYKTKLTSRIETLKDLSTSSFSVTNQQGITYTYKRFEPINITQ